MIVWIVGESKRRARIHIDGSTASELKGIFDNKAQAMHLCHTDKHWIAPVEMNRLIPTSGSVMVDAHYPKGKLTKSKAPG